MNDVKPRVHKCKGWVSFYEEKKYLIFQHATFQSDIIKHLKWDESCDNDNWDEYVSKGNLLL